MDESFVAVLEQMMNGIRAARSAFTRDKEGTRDARALEKKFEG